MYRDNLKRATEGRSGFSGLVTTGLDYVDDTWPHGQFVFGLRNHVCPMLWYIDA